METADSEDLAGKRGLRGEIKVVAAMERGSARIRDQREITDAWVQILADSFRVLIFGKTMHILDAD
jgi:hypothetical protein